MQALKWALAAGAAAATWATLARAAPCGRPDLVEALPPDETSNVPPNARLSARYAPSAEYLGEPVTLEHFGVGAESVPATFDANEGFLTIAPATPLVADDRYTVTWPALRGLTTATLGKGATVQFTAGRADDTEAPRFAGVRSVEWDIERSNDDCTDSAQDRFRFDLALGDANDDGPRELLTLVVFQTAGPNQPGGSPEQVLARRLPAPKERVPVRRAIDDTVGRVCFAALVRDSLGRVSNSAAEEVCATTVRPPFFYGCAMGATQGGRWFPMFVFWGLGMAARSRMRRRGAI